MSNNPTISVGGGHNLMFWLPPSENSTHVAINWYVDKQPEIFINGILQDVGDIEKYDG
jgi:hypothetical protein